VGATLKAQLISVLRGFENSSTLAYWWFSSETDAHNREYILLKYDVACTSCKR